MPLETPAAVKELQPEKTVRDSIFKETQLSAATQMPVAKRVALNFRWRVNFAEDQMPVLRINKIGIHRVDDVVKDEGKEKKNEGASGELDVLKSMCFWMKREVDVLTKANREMKSELEEVRQQSSGSGSGSGGGSFREGGIEKKQMTDVGSPIKQWKSGRDGGGGEGSGKREEKKKKNGSVAIDVENELQRAIMAAAAASPSP